MQIFPGDSQLHVHIEFCSITCKPRICDAIFMGDFMDTNTHAHTAHIPRSTEVAHIGVELNDVDYILGHGASRFLRPERYQDLKRKGSGATS